MHALACLHRVAVVVPEQVQQAVDERRAPRVADDVRAEHDVAERARDAGRHLVAAVEREREHVRRLVDAEVLALQRADFLGRDELEAELTVVDPFGMQHRAETVMLVVEVENRSGEAVDEDGAVAVARAVLAAEGVDEGELGLAFVHFGHQDVVRHKLVQRIVEAYREHAEETGTERRK